ncbi:MAG: hypothetical protein JXA89_06560 [Anaerolineae bacterium]|nr:hypothetical protein [Anaerolineae bacterium]
MTETETREHDSFAQRKVGDAMARVSVLTAALGCMALAANVLIAVFGGPIESINALRYGWLYILPASLALLAGIVAVTLPKRHRARKKRRAVIGMVLGIVLLVWAVYWRSAIMPWTMILAN